MSRLFNRFRHHGGGTFVRWERHDGTDPFVGYAEPNTVVYVPTGEEHQARVPIQNGLDLDFKAFEPGDPIRLQFGEMSRDTSRSRGGTRHTTWKGYRGNVHTRSHQAYTGSHCVTAAAFARPRLHLMTMRILEDELGSTAMLGHMRDWREGASTLQTAIDLRKDRRQREYTSINIDGGLMRATRRIADKVRIRANCIEIGGAELPETMRMGLIGRTASHITDHPFMASPDLLITHIGETSDGRTLQVYAGGIIDVADAIAILESEARRALPRAA